MIRVAVVAGFLALLVVILSGVAGREIISLIAGKRFEFAAGFFFLLSIAAAIDLAGFAFEPLQDAHGRAWKVLQAKLIAAAVYAALLAILLPAFGGEGAAIAAIICSLLIFVQLALASARILRTPNDKPMENQAEQTSLP